MRTIPYDVRTNMPISRRVVSTILETSKSFLPRNCDDLVAKGEENYTDGQPLMGNIVFHLDSEKNRFHVDVCSAMVPTKLYDSTAMVANLMEFLKLRDFHRTRYARRGFRNGRIVLTYQK